MRRYLGSRSAAAPTGQRGRWGKMGRRSLSPASKGGKEGWSSEKRKEEEDRVSLNPRPGCRHWREARETGAASQCGWQELPPPTPPPRSQEK